MRLLILAIISGLLMATQAVASPSLSATVRAEKCTGINTGIQATNHSDTDESTDLYHGGLLVARQYTLPPGEANPGDHCVDISVPDYSLPGGNVSPWFSNNSERLVSCLDAYDGLKVIVRGDTGSLTQRYEVYSLGGAFLYETVRGPWFYPNGYRSNTVRYSTTRCTGH